MTMSETSNVQFSNYLHKEIFDEGIVTNINAEMRIPWQFKDMLDFAEKLLRNY